MNRIEISGVSLQTSLADRFFAQAITERNQQPLKLDPGRLVRKIQCLQEISTSHRQAAGRRNDK